MSDLVNKLVAQAVKVGELIGLASTYGEDKQEAAMAKIAEEKVILKSLREKLEATLS